jgi:TetR/AcrR family transcriptional regulator, transcriptional repressor of bet genes
VHHLLVSGVESGALFSATCLGNRQIKMEQNLTMKNEANPTGLIKVSRAEAKAERRQQLIDATIESIARFGLSGTTMGKVTEIAGVSVGLANFHFESKERLFEAVLRHLADEQRALWQSRIQGPDRTSRELLQAIIESRFHATICDRKKLAVWFAFYGDASAREIYRKAVGDMDDERLEASVAIITEMIAEAGYDQIDPVETVLSNEAFWDGLWLNMLLYPAEFRRAACRKRALDVIAALLPKHFAPASGTD